MSRYAQCLHTRLPYAYFVSAIANVSRLTVAMINAITVAMRHTDGQHLSFALYLTCKALHVCARCLQDSTHSLVRHGR